MTSPKTALLPAALLIPLLFAFAPRAARGTASPWSSNPQSSVRLISPWQTASPKGELILGLQFRLAPGWHVYWKNSGDAGFPPTVTLQPAAAFFTPAEILWPAPRRFELPGNLVAFGYETEVVYPLRTELQPAAAPAANSDAANSDSPAGDAARDTLKISADLDYLVCQADCIPYRYTLTLDQPLADPATTDPETVGILQAGLERLPRIVREVPGLQTGAVLDASRGGVPELEVRVLGARAAAGTTDLFLESHDLFDAGRPRMRVSGDGVVFHLPLTPKVAGKALPASTSLAWTVTGLTGRDGKPFSLEARRDVPVWTDAGARAPDPLRTGGGGAADPFPNLLLWAFLGGALTNLAPVVLALLLAEGLALRGPGAATGIAGRGRREAAAAVVTGVVGACWGIAALALLARRSGWTATWPAPLREPVIGALAVVAAAVLALNLWGLLDFPLPRAAADPADPAERSGAAGTGRHLIAGLYAAPLALAWPLPLLERPVVAAFGRGPAAVCAVFAVAGFGIALPYLLLAVMPGGRRVGGPGDAEPESASRVWPGRLREAFGFLALGSSLWLLFVLSRQVSPEGLAAVELALLALGLFAWLRARPGRRPAARLGLTVLIALCAAAALWLADHNRLSPRVPPDATTRQATSLPSPLPSSPDGRGGRASKPTSGG
jgi:DsbC/DsbD-like thiol-disulfide interchange protein